MFLNRNEFGRNTERLTIKFLSDREVTIDTLCPGGGEDTILLIS